MSAGQTCSGCRHERAGLCTFGPKVWAPDISGPCSVWLWRFPPADERCGQFCELPSRCALCRRPFKHASDITGSLCSNPEQPVCERCLPREPS